MGSCQSQPITKSSSQSPLEGVKKAGQRQLISESSRSVPDTMETETLNSKPIADSDVANIVPFIEEGLPLSSIKDENDEDDEDNIEEKNHFQMARTSHSASSNLPTREKLRLSVQVCSAVSKLRSMVNQSIVEAQQEEKEEDLGNLSGMLKQKATKARLQSDNATGTLNASMRDSVTIALKRTDQNNGANTRPRLANIIMAKRFLLFENRYIDAQKNRTLMFPTLPQPNSDTDMDEFGITEMTRTRPSHRFIITADTQFGILMDGFSMEDPNWNTEIRISRACVKKINSMKGTERPLFVCVCGDLLDTEGSFGSALASWKYVMKGWERKCIFEQQIKDWKEVWSHLDEDIGMVCLCGNHDVGNRPTAASIQKWTSAFGDDYLAFWVNGAYNIGLNNCLFANPSAAIDLYEDQLKWLEGRLEYASARKASHIFVHSHYPWFIQHEDEEDETMKGVSLPPDGWGPEGTNFPDSYFNIPKQYRKRALSLFQKYNVKACFSGHFHQNVVNKTSWGMEMVITGPLSMMLQSTDQLSSIEEEQTIGFRVVDVNESSFQHEYISLEKETCCIDCSSSDEDISSDKKDITPDT